MTRKLTIEEMQKIAESRGGKCLSKEYTNAKTKLKWQCKEGHIWEATPDGIKNKETWCRKCSGSEKLTIEYMHMLAEERGGKCLSTKYFNAHTKLKWQCEKDHIWDATPHKIKNRGTWCPYCKGKYQTIEDMRRMATERGGKCLSTEYINNKTNLIWQCKEAHVWKATPDNIKRGQWCPICTKGISERICRQFFETIFNSKFPTKRPKWLINSRGNLMHLDGFNEELKLAFEYHGIQHFEYNPHFHRSHTLEQRKKDDEEKINLCKLNDIVLIEIPYTVEYNKMQKYIIEQYKIKTGLILDNVPKIDYNKFNIYLFSKLEELNEIAKQKEGKCLSTKYLNAHAKLKWQCKENHVWEATPDKIKRGSWCPKCAGNVRLTIEDMYKLAEKNNGKYLSIEYINAHIKLKWECEENHTFKASANSVKSGHWCPYCARNVKLTIEEMHNLAEKRGGKCLSIEYINAKTKLKWQCERRHIWMATPDNIKRGTWCPKCRSKK